VSFAAVTSTATAALVLALSLTANTANADQAPRFARLTVEDGLSQNSVGDIVQDRLGFLWFGTQEGLNRYDGYRFVVHRARNEPGFLRDHNITALIEDRRGDLWAGTSGGLHRLDLATGQFHREAEAETAHREILDVIEDGAGRIVFSASAGGLWVLDPGTNGRPVRRIESAVLSADATVTTLARGAGSTIWAAASGHLLRIDISPQATTVVEALRDLGTIAALATDAQGHVWVGSRESEPRRYDPRSGRVDRYPQCPRGTLTILAGNGGELWIGSRGGGLVRLDPATGEAATFRHDPDDASSVSKNDIAALYEDHSGNLWIGTWNGGVSRLDPYAQAFRTFAHRPRVPDSLPYDDVTAMAEMPDGRLWLGSRSGRLASGDPHSSRFSMAAPLAGVERVNALGRSGTALLVGTPRGLRAVEAGSGREVALSPPLRAALGEPPITSIHGGVAGEVWVAALGNLFRLTSPDSGPAGVHTYSPPLQAPVSAFFAASNGRVWVASQAGEIAMGEPAPGAENVRFRRLEVRVTQTADRPLMELGFITALHEDDQGRLWVGTRRGLGKIDPRTGVGEWLDERSGLPSTSVNSLLGDRDGFLWLATDRGLTRLDTRTGRMTHFGSREGAQGTGYAERACAKGDSGLLYFAGQGVTAFDPRQVIVNPHPPGIAFTALEILRKPMEPRWLDAASPLSNAIHSTDAMTLGPGVGVFSVEMAALHYSDPKSNRLLYRLEGFDPDWIETDASNRVATYTRLAPGDYVLRVRAATKNGVQSEHEARLAIRVLPPWWQTRSAIAGWLLLFLLAAVGSGAAVRRRTRVRIALMERETLRRESLTDALTGLHNRRFLATHLQHEVPKLLRERAASGATGDDLGTDLLFVVLDVDNFKSINDSHSHAAGDRVLVAVAKALRDNIRDSDLAIRWGGDEFLVVARSFHRREAAASVERLRRAVEALGHTLAEDGGPQCTVSIGWAAFPFLVDEPTALTWEQTLDLADRALMLTKRRQRNSHSGFAASPRVTSAALVEFLVSPRQAAALPEGIEIVTEP
jgi:diguanylate cyclase (GGDEF)-like protein